MAQIKTNKKIKSIILSVFHSVIIPISLGYLLDNLIWVLAYIIFAFAMYEYTEECYEKAGRIPFMILAPLVLIAMLAYMPTLLVGA